MLPCTVLYKLSAKALCLFLFLFLFSLFLTHSLADNNILLFVLINTWGSTLAPSHNILCYSYTIVSKWKTKQRMNNQVAIKALSGSGNFPEIPEPSRIIVNLFYSILVCPFNQTSCNIILNLIKTDTCDT